MKEITYSQCIKFLESLENIYKDEQTLALLEFAITCVNNAKLETEFLLKIKGWE